MRDTNARHGLSALSPRVPLISQSLPIDRLVVVAVTVFVAAYGGIVFTNHGARVAIIWPVNAFLLSVVLRSPRRDWLPYFITGFCANVAANMATGDRFAFALALSGCNTIEVVVAASILMRHFGSPPDLSQARQLAVFALICGGIAPIASGTLATIVFVIVRHAPPLSVIRVWVPADSLGMLTIGPLLVMVRRQELVEISRLPHLKETFAILFAVTAAATVIFVQRTTPVLFLVIPFLTLAAFRLRFVGAALATAIVAAVSVPLTEMNRGPLALMVNTSMVDRILVLQAFLAVAVFTTLPLAAVLATRQRLENEAVAARRAAEQANAAKSIFLHTMSHELRTPMAGIMGMCHLLLASTQTPNQRHVTETLERSARTFLELLNDILDIAKIEAGRMELEATDFKLSQVMGDVQELFAPAMTQKGLTFSIATEPTECDILCGDSRRLRQVLFNLVSNALKFTERGAVTVRRRQSRRPDSTILNVLEVEDTGIGLSAEAMGRLFRAFEQEDSSISRRYGGTGLGLYICKQTVEAMGGSIRVDSLKGTGSTFIVSLVLPPGTGTPVAESHAIVPFDGDFLRDLHLSILFAEDNPTIQLLVTQMISQSGHDIDLVVNGQEAVDRAAHKKYDVILMDMQMPVMAGTEATRIIRAGGGPSADTPIIALTADAILENRRLFLEAGCNAVVTKPIAWELLSREIRTLIQDPDRAASAARMPQRVTMPPLEQKNFVARPAQEHSAATIFDPLPIRDLRSAVGAATLRDLLDRCLSGMDRHLADIQQGVLTEDHARAKRAAHDLKSICAQFGAVRASEIARGIELDSADTRAVGNVIAELTESVVSASAYIQDIKGRL